MMKMDVTSPSPIGFGLHILKLHIKFLLPPSCFFFKPEVILANNQVTLTCLLFWMCETNWKPVIVREEWVLPNWVWLGSRLIAAAGKMISKAAVTQA